MRSEAARSFVPLQPGLGRTGPLGLSYREAAPPAALQGDVATLWEIAAPAPLRTTFVYRVVPDGCVDLVFDLANGGAWLFGARVEPFAIDLSGAVALFGIRVRPGGLDRVVAHPAGAIAGGSFAVDEVLGAAGRRLEARLAEQGSPAGRAAAVAAELGTGSGAGARDDLARALVDAVVAGGGTVPVPELATAIGVSARHLQRLCFAAVGLTPKQLGRVVRFQRALARLTSGAPHSLATLAADLGFSDQPHLNAELRALLGTTPGALLRAARSDFSKPARRAGR
jgi:AraC-like DNA-binding protein